MGKIYVTAKGERIRDFRIAARMTQQQLADKASGYLLGETISQSVIGNYERNECRIDLLRLKVIGMALNTSVGVLTGRIDDTKFATDMRVAAAAYKNAAKLATGGVETLATGEPAPDTFKPHQGGFGGDMTGVVYAGVDEDKIDWSNKFESPELKQRFEATIEPIPQPRDKMKSPLDKPDMWLDKVLMAALVVIVIAIVLVVGVL